MTHTTTHPAWAEWFAAHPFAGEIVAWEAGAKRPNECDVWEHEVALWMIVRGYEDDVQVRYESSLLNEYPLGYQLQRDVTFVYRYTLPPLTVEAAPEVEEEYLAVNPAIDPAAMVAYYARTLQGWAEVRNGSQQSV